MDPIGLGKKNMNHRRSLNQQDRRLFQARVIVDPWVSARVVELQNAWLEYPHVQ